MWSSTALRLIPRCTVWTQRAYKSIIPPVALRSKKAKSVRKDTVKQFEDLKYVRVIGGKGGNGAICFLHLWMNAMAGPSGGDGGNGGHVILQTSSSVNNLNHVTAVIKADPGEKGYSKDCHGKNAPHTVVKVPIGTVVRDKNGKVVADLIQEGMLFVAARGGAGGHGNHFFVSDTIQSPEIAEYGADGEDLQYILELCSMAQVGLIGLPNAGKSTLLQAISRARPKVAPYPFTTVKPHIGIVPYDDHEQVTVADLPGLIPDSSKNRGLGITFLKHIERCALLVFVVDASQDEPWLQLECLRHEIHQFSPHVLERPQLIVANKLDLPEAQDNLHFLKEHINEPVMAISAKHGTNLSELLLQIRKLCDVVKTG